MITHRALRAPASRRPAVFLRKGQWHVKDKTPGFEHVKVRDAPLPWFDPREGIRGRTAIDQMETSRAPASCIPEDERGDKRFMRM
jgi:hypothetical protein